MEKKRSIKGICTDIQSPNPPGEKSIILLCSWVSDSGLARLERLNGKKPTMSANVLQGHIIDGFQENGCDVRILSVPQLGTWPITTRCPGILGRQDEISEVKYLGYINIPFLRQLSQFVSIVIALRRIGNKQTVIVAYSVFLPFMLVCYLSKLIWHKQVYLVIPDLPEYMNKPRNRLYGAFREVVERRINTFVYQYVDGCVIIHPRMLEAINGIKQAVVIEGIYEDPKGITAPRRRSGFPIMYTGNLNKRYGLDILLEGFAALPREDAELWICGSGDMEKELTRRTASDSRIRFFGRLDRIDVLRMQREVALLIDPRDGSSEFSRFSFPSKLMEYLGSGTPAISFVCRAGFFSAYDHDVFRY